MKAIKTSEIFLFLLILFASAASAELIEESFGDNSSYYTITEGSWGNIFYADSAVCLYEHRLYLELFSAMPLCFFIYQSRDNHFVTGEYFLVDSVTYEAGPGLGWYTSGVRNYVFQSNQYYYMGTTWPGTLIDFRGTTYPPISCSFGSCQTGVPASFISFPPQPSFGNTFSGQLPAYQTIVTSHAALRNAPTAPSDFTVSHNNEELRASLSWINPSQLVCGDPLTQLSGVKVYRNSELIADLTDVQIGQPYNLEDTSIPSPNMYLYELLPYNSVGDGLSAYDSCWIGLDTPGAPLNVAAEPDSNNLLVCTITWDNPVQSGHGGYWPAGSWTGQRIYRDSILVADLAGTNNQYMDQPPANGYYSYYASYYNSSGEGPWASSDPPTVYVGLGLEGSYDVGGGNNDWPTIVAAVYSLGSIGMSGSVILNVYTGNYEGLIHICGADLPNLGPDITLTIQNALGEHPVVTNPDGYGFLLTSAPYVTIAGMEITNCEYDGIRLESGENDTCCHHCTIEGNYIQHACNYEDAVGLYYIENCSIIGNKINGGDSGIYYSWGKRNLFANNMLYDQRFMGMRISPGEEDEFYYNSIFMDDSSSTFSFAFSSMAVTNRIVKNNIFFNICPGPQDIAYELGWDLATYPAISDYNLLYSPNGTLVSCQGYWYTSLPPYQAATGLDLNSINQDPLFVSIAPGAYDLHLQPGSPAIEQGIPIEGILYDIDGDPRDPLHPCMGCDEVTFTSGLEITLAPVGTPIQIPANGGAFEFNIEVANSGTSGI